VADWRRTLCSAKITSKPIVHYEVDAGLSMIDEVHVDKACTAAAAAPWLTALRWYLVVIAVGNLGWEFAQLPLFTIWKTGSARDIIFAAAHCTGGDILIATASVVLALLFWGRGWPIARHTYQRVAALTVLLGLSYTVFSEWLNVVVRKSWAYSDLMPVVPIVNAGLSPLLQWIVVPLAAFWWAARVLTAGQR
jgi:hypothetical protein